MPQRYKWHVVAMLWWIAFFNYADRQAIFSCFPVLKTEMNLTDIQLGVVGSAFMWVYAAALPFAGLVGDRLPRKFLILAGLLFWSAITLATALSTRYWHLVLFRALEGLGEAFYFPASMSLISDYHAPATRSRAMSLHQSSVYAGTIAGGTAAGFFAQYRGWRSGFYLFGTLGILLALVLLWTLREPPRGAAESDHPNNAAPPRPTPGAERSDAPDSPQGLLESIIDVFRHSMVPVLIAVFIGANFVSSIFLTWMPTFLNRKFNMSLSMAGLNATAWTQIASVLGVVAAGALADRWRRRHPGGRMLTQSLGLLAGVPFVFLTGWTLRVPALVAAMTGFGFFKGFYDANVWASLYDVVPQRRRATAVGLMNALAWFGGAAAPVTIAAMSQRWGMSACISATSLIYLVFGLLMLAGVRAFMTSQSSPHQLGFPVIAVDPLGQPPNPLARNVGEVQE